MSNHHCQTDTRSIPFLQPWLRDLDAGFNYNVTDRPNYYTHNPSSHLRTKSSVESLSFGTGKTIYDGLESLLESATSEIILVTCFWARSETLEILNRVLLKLSSRARTDGYKIRVRICFSSSSLFQKLFHPQTPEGKVWDPQTWQTTLGLPSPEELSGLDLQIKSIFQLPFCVMHPKFIVIDRQLAVLPSCNVSWEEWFEGSVTLSGPVVQNFIQFWREFWASPEDREAMRSPPMGTSADDIRLESRSQIADPTTNGTFQHPSSSESQSSTLPLNTSLSISNVDTIFLPSPHHRNPGFRLPWQSAAAPPPTPLNTFILRALRSAERSVYIQTPNLTSPPVLTALLQTLERGIDVHVITSERLMILEQLVTAGTTTSKCVKKLIQRYGQIASFSYPTPESRMEEGRRSIGSLKIEYFEPVNNAEMMRSEPKQSHFKCTIVDDELTILGSGNLDRASWYTSQELGVAFFDKDFAETVMSSLEGVLKGRKKVAFNSAVR